MPSKKWGREKQGYACVERGEVREKPVSLPWLQHLSVFNTGSAAPGVIHGGHVLVASLGAGGTMWSLFWHTKAGLEELDPPLG